VVPAGNATTIAGVGLYRKNSPSRLVEGQRLGKKPDSSRVCIAQLKPHPLNSFISTTIYYCFLSVAYWISFSCMVVVRDAHPTRLNV